MGTPRTHGPARANTVDLFSGPRGWDEGARIAGLDLGIEGLDINRDANATATAAGHRARLADVAKVHPLEYEHCTGLIASPVCVPFADSGKRVGRGRDYQRVLDVWTSIGWGIDAADALADLDLLEDPQAGLLAIAGVWALTLPNLEWIAMEQAPSVDFAWEDLSPELTAIGWHCADPLILDAADFGLPSRRRRSFFIARRYSPRGHLNEYSHARVADAPTMAQALGWEPGHRIITRGNRRPTGGNAFSADGVAWCLTGRARSWEREDGLRLTPSQAGVLSGFRADYPWQGSRTSQFQQAGDVVAPPVAARVLASALGLPMHDVDAAVDAYLADLYSPQAVAA